MSKKLNVARENIRAHLFTLVNATVPELEFDWDKILFLIDTYASLKPPAPKQ